jgi:hypothetical protein
VHGFKQDSPDERLAGDLRITGTGWDGYGFRCRVLKKATKSRISRTLKIVFTGGITPTGVVMDWIVDFGCVVSFPSGCLITKDSSVSSIWVPLTVVPSFKNSD